MASPCENFSTEFHNLEGVTVSEKKRSLFKLLHKNKSLAADKIVANLNPKSHLENLFRLEVIIFFKRSQELFELLKENDRIFVNFGRLNWFFDILLNKSAVEILDLLTQISFSTRTKLLKGLSSSSLKNECSGKFDEIFDLVTNRYGISFGSKFIRGCSVEKVKEVVKLHPIALTSKELINFHKKDETFVEFYFEAYDDHENCHLTCENYKSLYRHIFKYDTALFFRLKDTYKTWRHKLGQKLTSKFVSLKKDEIVAKPNNYRDLLHLKTVFRMLKFEETKTFIRNSLPEKLSSLRYLQVEPFLNLYPSKIRFQVLESVISERYDADLSTQPNLISPRLLLSVRNSAKRHRIAKFLVEEGDDDYIKYMHLDESIPKLKTKINSSKAKDRKRFIRDLIETCKINDDREFILKLIKYSEILDNKNSGDQDELISCVHHKFGLQNLSQEIWDSINGIIKIRKIKGEAINDEIQLAHLEFAHKNHKSSFEELLRTYIASNYKYLNLWTKHQNPDFSKILINYVIEKAPEIVQVTEDEDDDLKRLDLKIIELIQNYNEKHPKINFLNYPRLAQTFKWSLNENKPNSAIHKVIKEKVLDLKCADRDDYMRIFWNRMEINADLATFKWFLKYDPATISKYLDDNLARVIVEFADTNLWSIIKKYHHLELDDKFVDFCLRSSAETSIKSKVIECLSHLMSPEQYLELADRIFKRDLKCEEICGVVASNFKNLESYRKILTQFLSFYNKSPPALSKMLRDIPENLLPRYLHQMASNKNGSVRKLALNFTCEFCDLGQVEAILETLHIQSRNGHRSNLKTLVAYFHKNPSSNLYESIKNNVSAVYDCEDDKVFENLAQIQVIPSKFRANYVEFLWKFVENSLVASHRQDFLRQLLNHIITKLDQDICKDLTLKFCTKIIQKNLFNCIDSQLEEDNIRKFAITLLKVHPNKLEVLKLVLEIVKQPTLITKSEILEFLFTDCYDISMQTTKNDEFVEIYINFVTNLNIIKPNESFPNYLKIFFLKMRRDFLTEPITVESFAEKTVKFFRELTTKYGPYILDLFAKAVNDNIHYFCVDNIVSEYHYYEGLLKVYPDDYSVSALALQLTKSSPRLSRWEKPIKKNIIELLKLVQDPGIEIIVKNCSSSSYN